MKIISRLLVAAMLVFAMAACGDKEDDTPTNTTTTNPGTNPGTDPGNSSIKMGSIINNGSITIAGYTFTNVSGVDFDNDGVLEFRIAGDDQYPYIDYNWTEGGNNIVNIEDQWDVILPLGNGASIGESSRFEGQGDASFGYILDTLPQSFYIGCRIKKDSTVHYGWVNVHSSSGQLSWGECAYNTTPNAEIRAGQK